MCGIAGFSLSTTSRVNARALSHSLLKQIENRGSHASGFAYSNADGAAGVYKSNKPGSQLPLYELPRRSDTVILHTRYATQGSPSDNRNNHPVISPDLNVALVHNGVINNDGRLRADFREIGIELDGEVDSIVIPALVELSGVDDFDRLSGYAAVSWVDQREPGVLNIARLKTSPVAYTYLRDGSFVFASTPALLLRALDEQNLDYGGIFEMEEAKHIIVANGFVEDHMTTKRMTYDYQSYQRHGAATAGGHGKSPDTSRATGATHAAPNGTTTPADNGWTKDPQTGRWQKLDAEGKVIAGYPGQVVPRTIVPNPPAPKGGSEDEPRLGSSFGNIEDEGDQAETVEAYMADLDAWRAKRALQDEIAAGKALAVINGEDYKPLALEEDDEAAEKRHIDELWDKIQESWLEQEDEDAIASSEEHLSCSTDFAARYKMGEGYYILDQSGNIHHSADLDELERKLRWFADMSATEADLFTVDKSINWVNWIMDLGAVNDDGQLVSWVEDSADIDEHESPAVRNLQHIRDGVQYLERLAGA